MIFPIEISIFAPVLDRIMMNFYIRLIIILLLFTTFSAATSAQRTSRVPRYEEYIKKYKTLAIRQQKEYKIPASITLAQGLLESGAGTSRLAVEGKNHFGIKCKEEWTGKTIYHTDDAPNECFRAYNTVEDSFVDHSRFLARRKYYVSLFTLDIYDYKAWANGLQKCGYATDKGYGAKLINLIETYELYKYDRTTLAEEKRKKTIEADDNYEIKIEEPEGRIIESQAINDWRRRIHQVNDVHFITAQENDTYEVIAAATKLSLKRLMKYNDVTADVTLKEGDFVFLQAKKKYAAKGSLQHTVQEGESMHSISQKYGMKLKTLYKLNKLPNDYSPNPGDVLKLRKK
jgi:LysM repeat protein